MTNRNEKLAAKVVAAFQDILSDEALSYISEKEFQELGLIVREALSQELSEAADMVEEVAQRLRGMTEPKELEL